MNENQEPLGDLSQETGVPVQTLRRWARKGVVAPDGERIYLQITRIGKKWLSSRAAIERFNERLAQVATA